MRFADFYEQIVVPLCPEGPAAARFIVLRAQDGARTSLPLEDLLGPDVLLADHLDGQPLPETKLRNTAPRCASSPRPTTATQAK